MTSIKDELLQSIDTKVNLLKGEINKDLEKLRSDYAALKKDVEQLKLANTAVSPAALVQSPLEDIDKCIVVTKFPDVVVGELKVKIEDMLQEILEDEDKESVEVLECKRMGAHSRDKPGLVKVAVNNLDSKKLVLRAKTKLKDTVHYKNVWMRSSMPHLERIFHMNMKNMLKLVPDGDQYFITGSGKMVRKNEEQSNDEDGGEWQGVHRRDGRGRGGMRGGPRGGPRGGGRGTGRGRH